MVLTDNIAHFQTTLSENERPLRTTLRENETTLFENRPITSGLDHINANSCSGIPAAGSPPCNSWVRPGASSPLRNELISRYFAFEKLLPRPSRCNPARSILV